MTKFVIVGEDTIEEKLKQVDDTAQRQGKWLPNEHLQEFKDLAKHFMFLAQGDSKAPVTSSNIVNKVDEYVTKASNYENIMFWTLQQLSVVNSLQMLFVFLDAFYGTGKSLLLRHVAIYWSKEIGKLVKK